MIHFRILFFIIAASSILLSSNSCSIETAKPSTEKELFIISDYLSESDTIIFQEFINKEKVILQIINMESDKIIGLTRNQGTNVQADLILVKSLYDIHKISKRDILHTINFSKELSTTEQKHSSWKFNYVGFGLDPFIIACPENNFIRTYNDLLQTSFVNELSERELISMLSPVMYKMKRVKANKWIKKFISHSKNKMTVLDSNGRMLPILTTHSSFSTNQDTILNYQQRIISYPNSKSSGSFFNIRTIGIVDQAQNYIEAKAFINYYLTSENNIKLNKRLHTFSIHPNNESFRRYKAPNEKLIQYYQIVDRLLKKLN